MNLAKKYYKEVLLLVGIIVIYFVLRIPNLTLQPIFADEAIYIRWAQVIKAEPTLRFLPLSDGKTPLFMWLMIPSFKFFEDPLLAGRLLSVFSGFGTLLGVLFLCWKFFDRKVALWASFLIATVPFIVFFDRMALVDSMLAFFTVWSLFFALLLVKYPRFDLAMVLGYFLGGGLLTKPPGFFNVIALPVTGLLINLKEKTRQSKLLRLFGLWVITVAITLVIYNILRLGPGFSNLNSRNQDYVFDPVDLLDRPLDPFIPHFLDLVDWFPKLLTSPVLALIIFGIFWGFIKRNKLVIVIFLWGLLPLLIEMALLKTFTARYILFSIAPFLILAAWGITQIEPFLKSLKRFSLLIFLVLLLPLSIDFNYKLITNPAIAPLPKNERTGYLEDWTAGYGLKEIALYLEEQSKKGTVVVGTEGSFGTLPDGLQIYLDKNRKVVVIGGKEFVSDQIRSAALKNQTFFVANRSRYKFFDGDLELIKEYPKAFGAKIEQDAILFFKVNPSKNASSSAKPK